MEILRDASEALGAELAEAARSLPGDPVIRGGGLRHGDVEFQVKFGDDSLDRYLFVSLEMPDGRLLTVDMQAAATDSKGGWAYAPVARTTLPREIYDKQVSTMVQGLVRHGLAIATLLGKDDLSPPVDMYFDHPQGRE